MNYPHDRIRRFSRIYEKLLWLFPRAHRDEYGALMAQFFRDQCRAAITSGKGSSLTLQIFKSLPDLTLSASREHLTQQIQLMKNSAQSISLALFVTAITAGLLSCSFSLNQPTVAVALAYFTVPVLLLRAYFEWKRPEDELVRSLVWGAVIAVIFALIVPIWGKVKLPVIPWVVIPMLLNGFVPLIRTALRVTRRLTNTR